MTTKLKARKFRIRRLTPLTDGYASGDQAANIAPPPILLAQMPVAPKPTTRPYRPRPVPQMMTPQGDTDDLLSSLQTSEQPMVMPGEIAEPMTGYRPALAQNIDSPAFVAAETDLDAIRREGLTGRQLRMARRVAQKHGLAVTSDFDAVRQLRSRGIDPFKHSNILELVRSTTAPTGTVPTGTALTELPRTAPNADGRIQLPQIVPDGPMNLPSTERISPAERRVSEVMKIQRDIAKRRQRKILLLLTRLTFFVLLPTLIAGWYFFMIATPMYATKSEFVIQKAEAAGAAGLGGLFQGTSMATQQDSTTVQSYLTSRAAMLRLDQDHGFRTHFSQPSIDAIQRLPEGASNEKRAQRDDHANGVEELQLAQEVRRTFVAFRSGGLVRGRRAANRRGDVGVAQLETVVDRH